MCVCMSLCLCVYALRTLKSVRRVIERRRKGGGRERERESEKEREEETE